MQTKAEIRKIIKKKRDALDKEQKKNLNEKIHKNINSGSFFKNAKNILFYVSFKNEVDTLNLISDNFSKKNIFVPKVNGKNIEIYQIESMDDLEAGAFGIPEPKIDSKTENFNKIDLAFIPGIAFDRIGHRIGFGKGFYDKLNKKLCCLKVGLAYSFQIVENIPADKHDEPVDLIITDSEIIEPNI
jgi:5-formyltetrahydrofolate cyclo-ligase